MKYCMAFLLAISVASCATHKNIEFSYSGIFKGTFPLNTFSGATIFTADALSFKNNEGNTISALVAYSDTDSIPMGFDMRTYPDIVFGLKQYAGESKELSEKLLNTKNAYAHSYDLMNISVENKNEVTRYSVCKDKSCLGFVVKDSFPDHILMVFSDGLSKENFLEVINGAFYVK